jgi:glycosyltransferase involved in cell wall biosynthesis
VARTETLVAPVARSDARLALPQRTILIHDYLNQYGGAERVLEVLHEMAPGAPVYTSIYDREAMPKPYREWDVRTTWVDRVPGAHRHHQRLLPAYPLAFDRLELPPCDLVLSSSSAFAKMVRPPVGAVHVCYCHAPMRFAWNLDAYISRERLHPSARIFLSPLMALLRRRDRVTASRVDRFVANSTAVRDRIRAFWRRDATVVYPPVDVERFASVPQHQVGEYFLMVSRLVPYKRFDLAIEACNALGLPLWIVGDGRDRPRLERMAGPTIRFLGRVSDTELADLYARCRAAIFMSEDDFGIAQVEAQAAGRPVVALAAGGAWDTVEHGVTGVHVRAQTTGALIDALRRLDQYNFDSVTLAAHAAKFSRGRFAREIVGVVEETLAGAREKGSTRWS